MSEEKHPHFNEYHILITVFAGEKYDTGLMMGISTCAICQYSAKLSKGKQLFI
jgi:hypothetical protein